MAEPCLVRTLGGRVARGAEREEVAREWIAEGYPKPEREPDRPRAKTIGIDQSCPLEGRTMFNFVGGLLKGAAPPAALSTGEPLPGSGWQHWGTQPGSAEDGQTVNGQPQVQDGLARP